MGAQKTITKSTDRAKFVGLEVIHGGRTGQFAAKFSFAEFGGTPAVVTQEEPDFSIAAQKSRSVVERLREAGRTRQSNPKTLELSLATLHSIFRKFFYRSANPDALSKGAVLDTEDDISAVIDNIAKEKRLDFSINGDKVEVSRVCRKSVLTKEIQIDKYLSGPWRDDQTWLDE